MSSKKFTKRNDKHKKEQNNINKSTISTWKIWVARGIVIFLCIALIVTLAPSVFI